MTTVLAPSRPAEPDEPSRPTAGDRFWAGVHLLGRALITLSVLMVLFVVYQLWGTNLLAARDQRALKEQFTQRLEAARETPVPSPGHEPTGRPAPVPEPVVEGEAVALLEIPAIGAEFAVVEGVGLGDLRKGPGHYPTTPLPGEAGNAGIAGHRTTYGGPFNELDELRAGDEVVVTTVRGQFTYRVTGSQVVSPRETAILDPTDDNRLTLTTCHPEFSSRERLVVTAALADEPVDAAPRAARQASAGDGRSETSVDAGHSSGLGAVDAGLLGAGAALAAVGGAWWWLFRRRRSVLAWLGGAVPFSATLFVFFTHLERVLPSSY